jgi:hypothetical protein
LSAFFFSAVRSPSFSVIVSYWFCARATALFASAFSQSEPAMFARRAFSFASISD